MGHWCNFWKDKWGHHVRLCRLYTAQEPLATALRQGRNPACPPPAKKCNLKDFQTFSKFVQKVLYGLAMAPPPFLTHLPDCHSVGVRWGQGIHKLKKFPGDSDPSQGWEPGWRRHMFPHSWKEILISYNTQWRGVLVEWSQGRKEERKSAYFYSLGKI